MDCLSFNIHRHCIDNNNSTKKGKGKDLYWSKFSVKFSVKNKLTVKIIELNVNFENNLLHAKEVRKGGQMNKRDET